MIIKKILVTLGLSTPCWTVALHIRHLLIQFGPEFLISRLAADPNLYNEPSPNNYTENLAKEILRENPAKQIIDYRYSNQILLAAVTVGVLTTSPARSWEIYRTPWYSNLPTSMGVNPWKR
jgi:hypothetical protein